MEPEGELANELGFTRIEEMEMEYAALTARFDDLIEKIKRLSRGETE